MAGNEMPGGCELVAPAPGLGRSSSLNAIPDDVLEIIFGKLRAKDRSRLAAVCRDWRKLTTLDKSAWAAVSVRLRPLKNERGTAAVDRAPFREWLARHVGMLRRLRIWARPQGVDSTMLQRLNVHTDFLEIARHKSSMCGLSSRLLPLLAEAPKLRHCELWGWLPGCALQQLSLLPSSLRRLTAYIKDDHETDDGPDEEGAPGKLGNAISHLVRLTSLTIAWRGEVGDGYLHMWRFPVELSALTALRSLSVDWRHPDQIEEFFRFEDAQRLNWKRVYRPSAGYRPSAAEVAGRKMQSATVLTALTSLRALNLRWLDVSDCTELCQSCEGPMGDRWINLPDDGCSVCNSDYCDESSRRYDFAW